MIYKTGDLLIRVRDKRPCVVVETTESRKKEWGQLDANRRLYKLFDGDRSDWLTDTQIRAGFDRTTP